MAQDRLRDPSLALKALLVAILAAAVGVGFLLPTPTRSDAARGDEIKLHP